VDSLLDRNARPLIEFHGVRDLDAPDTLRSPLTLAAWGTPTGTYQTLAAAPESPLAFEQRQIDLFVHDYFRARPGLTFNLGVRLEIGRNPQGSQRLTENFDPSVVTGLVNTAVSDCVQATNDRNSCEGLIKQFGAAIPRSLETVFGVGLNSTTFRAGFAWDPGHTGRTVIRGGSGIYSGTFPFTLLEEARSVFNSFMPVNALAPNPNEDVLFGLDQLRALNLTSLNVLPDFTNPVNAMWKAAMAKYPVLLKYTPVDLSSLKNSYSIQLVLSLERELSASSSVAVSYIGTGGRRLLQASTPAGGPAASGISLFRPDPSVFWASVPIPRYLWKDTWRGPVATTTYGGTGSSSYNSLQLEVRTRHREALESGFAFTYSHSIDNASDFYDTLGSSALPQDSWQPSERGNSSFDARYRASGYSIWRVPSVAGVRFLTGWQVLAVGTAQSGQPYTVNSVYDLNRDGNLTDRLDNTAYLQAGSNSQDRRTQLRVTTTDFSLLYRPLSFNPPLIGTLAQTSIAGGRLGRNTFRSTGIWNVDVALAKSGVLPRIGAVALRLEAFNLCNHANFGIPVRALEAPGFGSSVSTVTPSRTIQIVIKKQF
jgi:hypothetical protein